MNDYQELITRIAEKHGKTVTEVMSPRRNAGLMPPRAEIYSAMRKDGLSYPAIGKIMGKDHTTILHTLDTWAKKNKVKVFRGRTKPKR